MTLDMTVTLVVMVGVVFVLARELVSPAAAMLGAVVGLVVVGVAEPEVAFAGFSSSATLTIAGLFVIAGAIQAHGGLEAALARLLQGAGERRILLRMSVAVASMSTVIANTPIVATLAPMVRDWAERTGRAPSRYLMPLSFAALLGGVVTTIGTSTTLVVSGLVPGGFSFFEVTPVGLPAAVLGTVVMVALAPRLLPERRSSVFVDVADDRRYTFRLRVVADGPLAGRSIAAAGLRNLDDVFLAAVTRGRREPRPVRPSTVLEAGDVLTFVGGVDHVEGLRSREGLQLADQNQVDLLEGDGEALFEAVVGPTSPLVGRTPKGLAFRGRYAAAIVAVHRGGERIEGQLGEVAFQSGDALLLLTDADFRSRWQPQRDFAVIVPHAALDPVTDVSPLRLPVLAITATMVVAAGFGVPILRAVLAACLVMGLLRIVRFWDARTSLDLDVLIIVASAIGLGGVVTSSGLAARAAGLIEGIADAGGPTVALLAVLLGTTLLTEIVTNVAASALMVPIALDVAGRVGEDPRGWAVGVAIMASTSFLTPIGYQTNTIVYGLGGYRFGDYWRLGLPITVVVMGTALVMIPWVW